MAATATEAAVAAARATPPSPAEADEAVANGAAAAEAAAAVGASEEAAAAAAAAAAGVGAAAASGPWTDVSLRAVDPVRALAPLCGWGRGSAATGPGDAVEAAGDDRTQTQAQAQAQAGARQSEPLKLELPVCGNLDGLSAAELPSAEQLLALLQRGVDVASSLAAEHPHVVNLDKMARRIRSDLEFVRRCLPPPPPLPPTAPTAPTQPTPRAAATVGAGAATGGASATAASATAQQQPTPGLDGCVGGTEAAAHGEAGSRSSSRHAVGAATAATAAAADAAEGASTCAAAPGATASAAPMPLVEPAAPEAAAAAAAGPGPQPAGAPAGEASSVKAAKKQKGKHTGPSTPAAPPPRLTLTPERVQGIVNNLRGFQGELLAAQLAPGVVGVLRRFTAHRCGAPAGSAPAGSAAAGGAPAGSAPAGSAAAAAASAAAVGQKRPLEGSSADRAAPDVEAGAGRGAALSTADQQQPKQQQQQQQQPKQQPKQQGKAEALVAEVDVVAQGGHAWIEVKNQEAFGLESVHWTGAGKGAGKGLRRQVEEMLAVAAAPQHLRRWRPPAVVLFFPDPSFAHPAVVAELRAMGAHVALGPEALRAGLPPPPPLPAATCLDVTTMCGLVSEMSHGGAAEPSVQAWARRTVHWVECLEAERARPLLAEIGPLVGGGRPLLAAELAVAQFQTLLDMFGGARERQRWAELRSRLQVVDTQQRPEELSERCRTLLGECLGRDQLAVFGLGDGRRALTLTANGNAVRSAERLGVALEVVLHRPVWLTGR
ncbi:hypothetical protein HYH02_008310 [Chlamydomonas schloesseri]|uniref:DUF1308 domain-containing protein n=1 Tax=Chlamydomonas schloesseri TaxID=2026947 RepID=A0A835WGD4_9CHLO|nr:hypothetical protein HYH02_008310 [Chlamydomonas schloesseri]|eukprot:KAG2446749.1 hypothetical protein HYH02_008310 [Chlamydomonas schloesseri]